MYIFSYVELPKEHISEDTSDFFLKIGTMSVNTDREEDYISQSVI